jgi:hypothetical protein
MGGPLNFFGSNPNIFYVPAIVACACILFFTHEYVASLKRGKHPNELTESTPPVSTAATPSSTPRTRPAFSEKVDHVTIDVGSNTMTVDLRLIGNEKEFPIVREGGHTFVTGKVVNGQLILDAEFPDGVHLKNGQLTNRPDNWDRNWDATAIEIVDENRTPVLQLTYIDDSTAKIRGIFLASGGLQAVTDEGVYLVPLPPIPLRSLPPILRPIFKYPSESHRHERN